MTFTHLLRPGDRILVGSGAGEPFALVEELVARRHELPEVEIVLGYPLAATIRPEHVPPLRVTVLGGYGTNNALVDSGSAAVLACHQSALPDLVARGELRVDVVLAQVSTRHSLGVTADVVAVAAERARVVVAEVNDQMPHTYGDTELAVDQAVPTSRPLPELTAAAPTEVERRIAERVAELIPDRAVLQFGIGRLPAAAAALLRDHRDLGVHSGLLGDWVVDLIEAGAVTNAAKPIDRGVTVGGLAMGSRRLYDWADRNRALSMRDSRYTHGAAVLSELDTLVTVNSAIEVDLTGQVNAELAGARYVGAVGGHTDYVRAGSAAANGRSIIALPSTSGGGSRIVTRVRVVTTPRTEVDTVVTEHGVARLRGRTLAERARLLTAIAAPEHRDHLREAARSPGSQSP